MSTALTIEPTSTVQLLSCMALAIDEAKLVRSLIESTNRVNILKTNDPCSSRSIYLTREITHIEAKLIQVRNKAADRASIFQ